VAGFLVGTLTVFFDVAYQAYLPALVGREHLIEGNSKLEASRSMAQLSGPGIAGALIQALSAPWALLVNALSFFCSALFIGRIRTPESPPPAQRAPLLHEVREGIAVVLANRILRSIAGCTGTWNFFTAAWYALYILFATRELGLHPAAIGAIASLGNVAGLIASLAAGTLASRLGIGRVIAWAALLSGFSAIPIALATPSSAVALLTLAGIIMSFGGQIYNINQVSLRQAVVPQHLQGRMNATMRFLVWGTMPLGGLAGGFLGGALGLRSAIAVGAAGSLVAFLWIWLSPVRTLSRIPTPAP
jgi:MFS family permease